MSTSIRVPATGSTARERVLLFGAGLWVDRRYRLTVSTDPAVPTTGPLILAANHVSTRDPVVLMLTGYRIGLRPRPLALTELYRIPPVRWALRTARAIPIRRGRGGGSGLDAAAAALREGEVVLIYPEGQVTPPSLPAAARSGVGRLVKDTGATVVPVTTWGLHASQAARRWWRTPAAVIFGAPLMLEQLVDRRADELAAQILARIREQIPLAQALSGSTARLRRPS